MIKYNENLLNNYVNIMNVGKKMMQNDLPCNEAFTWNEVMLEMHQSLLNMLSEIYESPQEKYNVPAEDYYFHKLIGKKAVKFGLIDNFEQLPIDENENQNNEIYASKHYDFGQDYVVNEDGSLESCNFDNFLSEPDVAYKTSFTVRKTINK